MKVYLITERDLEDLHNRLKADPKRISKNMNFFEKHRSIYNDVYRDYNYQVCNWIDGIKDPKASIF